MPANKGIYFNVAFDTALIIAFFTAAFFFSGTVYFEEYYLALGIPDEQIKLPTEKIMLYGAIVYFTFALTTSLLAAPIALLSILVIAFSKITQPPLPYYTIKILGRLRQKKASVNFCLMVLIAFLMLMFIWYASTSVTSRLAKKNAKEFLETCTADKFSYKNGDNYHGCYVTEGETNYFVLVMSESIDRKKYQTLLLPKDGIKNISLH